MGEKKRVKRGVEKRLGNKEEKEDAVWQVEGAGGRGG